MAKISSITREYIYNRDGNECLRCGSKQNLTIDHVIPIGMGGLNSRGNMQTLCCDCNNEKGMLLIDYRWIEHLPKSWFNISIPLGEAGYDYYIPDIKKQPERTKRSKKRSIKALTRELGFYDNPVTMDKHLNLRYKFIGERGEMQIRMEEYQLFLQNQTPEQFELAKRFGWEFAKMITAAECNFHEDAPISDEMFLDYGFTSTLDGYINANAGWIKAKLIQRGGFDKWIVFKGTKTYFIKTQKELYDLVN